MGLKIATPAALDDLSKLNNDELAERFKQTVELTVAGIVESARIWHEMKQRPDFDIGKYRIFDQNYFFSQIHAGTVLPEVVFCLNRRESLMKKVVALTPTEQRELVVEQKPVEVVERAPEGSPDPWTYRMMDLSHLLVDDGLVNQVFGERCIRSRSEQIAYLSKKQPLPSREPTEPVHVGNWIVDTVSGTAKTVKGKSGALADLRTALKKAGITSN